MNELNELMATKAMGWKLVLSGQTISGGVLYNDCYFDRETKKLIMLACDWNPSGTSKHSMGQAMMCADKMDNWAIARDGDYDYGFSWDGKQMGYDYSVCITQGGRVVIHSLPPDATLDELPLAICEAIEAIGGKDE